MKKTYIYQLTIVMLLACSMVLKAENFEFKVIAAKGKASIQKKGSSKWVNLSIGNIINKEDNIKLEADSYVGMIHSGGNTVEIRKAGQYSAKKLSKDVAARKSKLAKRVAGYVIDEISDAKDLTAKENYRGQMGEVGAVERAVGDEVDPVKLAETIAHTDNSLSSSLAETGLTLANSTEFINTRFPRSSYFIDTKVDFSWYPKAGNEKYQFRIYDNTGKDLFTKELNETSISVDFASIRLERNRCYYWSVSAGKAKSAESCIFLPDENKSKMLKDSLDEMMDEFGSQPDAINWIYLAAWCEEHNLMMKVVESYQKAIELAPGVSDYKKMYALYLDRNGLIEEARKVLK